jgi:predicted ATPase
VLQAVRRPLSRIVLRNYKSIGACDVRRVQLSFLVGPNGSGKSNFLDGLRFVTDGLRFSLDHALRDRGGIQEVRRGPPAARSRRPAEAGREQAGKRPR